MKVKNLHQFSRFTDKGPPIAERVIRSIRNLIKKPVFEKRNADATSEVASIFNHYKRIIHHSTKMTPIQAFRKANEKEVFSNPEDWNVIQKSKFKLGQLIQTADIKKKF